MKPSSAGDIRRYMTGFVLALVLTFFAFSLVAVKTGVPAEPLHILSQFLPLLDESLIELPRRAILATLLALACLQIGVHMRYFLHLDLSHGQRPAVRALLFTLLIIFIVVCGTLWIISDLNEQMMPD